LRAAPES
jgi:hypothetical protein